MYSIQYIYRMLCFVLQVYNIVHRVRYVSHCMAYTMYSILCIQCTPYNVHNILYNTYCTMYTVYCVVYIVQYIVSFVRCTMQYVRFIVQCTTYFILRHHMSSHVASCMSYVAFREVHVVCSLSCIGSSTSRIATFV